MNCCICKCRDGHSLGCPNHFKNYPDLHAKFTKIFGTAKLLGMTGKLSGEMPDLLLADENTKEAWKFGILEGVAERR